MTTAVFAAISSRILKGAVFALLNVAVDGVIRDPDNLNAHKDDSTESRVTKYDN